MMNWLSRDKSVVWHPFTPMKQWLDSDDERGRIIVDGEGFELIDEQGNRFIDGHGSMWCNLHGHRVPAIDEAIRRQLDEIAHSSLLGHGSPRSIELAERLGRLTPDGLSRAFFSDNGATAVEIALKMAFQYYANAGETSRRKYIALNRSYHGDTIGSVSLGGIHTFHATFGPLLFDTAFVDSPNPYHHPAGEQAGAVVLEQMDKILRNNVGEYIAVIVEPLIQGAAGMRTQTPGFLAGVRELTHKHNVLMIVDEVATGFCRTGRLFACEHESVSPDLMCLGKGMTGGYLPVSATMATAEIFEGFCGELSDGKTFYHGHTFTGNALGCAAGVASVDLIEQTGLLDSLPAKVGLIREKLSELKDHPNVGDIRQCGMMVGIELVEEREEPTFFDPHRRVGFTICQQARRKGIIIRPIVDTILLVPAPAMDTETLSRLLDATIASIREFFA